MSLKSFVMSGIKDVLESQVAKVGGKGGDKNPGGNNNPQGAPPPMDYGSSSQNYGNAGYNGAPTQYGQGGSGYPPQGQTYNNMPGYQPQAPQNPYDNPGSAPYPPTMNSGGAPPIGFQPAGAPGYPPTESGYPSANPGYPSSNPGYPTGNPGYPTANPGYPSANPGYPSSNPGYPGGGQYPTGGNAGPNAPYGGPSQQGYAPNNQSYQGGYPQQQQQQQQYAGAGSMLGTPSIYPFPGFNANQDAEVLRKAMKGLGCDNSKVVSVLCARTNLQRLEITRAFKVMYGKDLIKELRGELSGDFEDLILALMEPEAVYDAKQLHKAMEGLGTKESVLIEIMTSRTNQQVAALKSAYHALYKRDLERELVSETSGWFKRLLVSLSAGGRDESNFTDPLRANQDARKLFSAGERRLGTDESMFNSVLASQNYAQLRLVFDEYAKVAKHPIEKAIDSEFSGDIRDGMHAVVAVVRNRPAYFARLLHQSMKGLGTRDNDLIRLVVTRCEYDMADIRNAFQSMFKTTLEQMIVGDCSGAYKNGLIALVKGNR